MILMEVSSRLPGLEHAQSWRIALPDATMTGNALKPEKGLLQNVRKS